MNSCIVFDLDGTLIDSREDLTTGVNLMRAHFGLEGLSVDTVTSYVGNGARNLAIRALQGHDADIEHALSLMKKFYSENMLVKTHLYPGVAEGLGKLHSKGWKLAVITNKPSPAANEILEKLKVKKYLSYVLGGDSAFPLKPDPASLIYVLNETSSLPEKSWMLGDNYTDLEAGRRAGIKRCFARYGFGRQGNENYDAAIDSFDGILKLLLP
ncbi:MAG: hypothetical protein A2017_06865 [Lentisphaerae bacterium GWF2_44_16]|nr:MAG: hypothetical protein A2017_06865 [Lentisphaerae bacterium GWF2_44_16]